MSGFDHQPPIRNRCRRDHDIGREGGLDGGHHVARGLDMDHPQPRRVGQRDRSGDQNDLGSGRRRRSRDRVALSSGGSVGEEAHRIESFVGRSGGHHHATPRQELRRRNGALRQRNDGPDRQCSLDGSHDVERFGHAAGTEFAAGHDPLLGPDREDAVVLEQREVALGRRMEPHPDIHGRREENPLVGREEQRAREVIGDALRHLGHEIGGGWCHDQQVGRAGQFDMTHFGLVGQREQVVVDPFSCKARDRQGGDESLGGCRHHGPDATASFTKTPHEVKSLVGRDAAADHQEDAPVRQSSFDRHDLSTCSDAIAG